jgi:putative transposase
VDSKIVCGTGAGRGEETTADAESEGTWLPGIDDARRENGRDVEFSPGVRFKLGELMVELVYCLTLDRVVVTDLRTGETRVVTRAELTPVEATQHEQLERAIKLEDVTEEMLVKARACEEALRPYLAAGTLSLTDARRLAKTLGVSTRTVRRWIQRYKHQGDITAFLPAPRGARRGRYSLDPAVEAIIEFAVNQKLQSAGNCTVRSVKEAIRADCEAIGKAPPAAATVLDRMKKLKADAEVLPSEVGRQVRERTRLVRGSAETRRPLERVEIDHTLVDTHIVDAKDGGPLGRPWLTIAIDVFTRVVLGFYLALEHPSRLSLALCLRHAILPKDGWLKQVGAVGPWPVFGRPRCIYTDNGADFRSLSFRLGCQRQHIENGYRPVRQPRYGGTVERLIGTFMRRTRLIPGNTFNEILNKKSPEVFAGAI